MLNIRGLVRVKKVCHFYTLSLLILLQDFIKLSKAFIFLSKHVDSIEDGRLVFFEVVEN